MANTPRKELLMLAKKLGMRQPDVQLSQIDLALLNESGLGG
jgi:hypothetical protein